MSNPLPQDPYITAVTIALAAAELEPNDSWTSGANTNRYDTGPNAGCTMQLDAYLDWDPEHPALNTGGHRHGIALIWEHPAEQWQWAPRRADGVLAHDPEFLVLSRWASPHDVVTAVRELLAGRPAPKNLSGRWHLHVEAQAAVDVWAADES